MKDIQKTKSCTISGDSIDKFSFGLDEKDLLCIHIKTHLIQTLHSFIKQGITDFYVNCEFGIPLWAAEILTVLKQTHKITINIAIPFEEQSTKWAPNSRERYFKVHSLADDVTLIDYHLELNSYLKADIFMINNSQYLMYIGNDMNSFICQYAQKKQNIITFLKV